MEVEYINPFIIGALEVFEQIADIELKKEGVTLKDTTTPSNEIAIIINITGYLTGQVVYSFKEHTAQRIVGTMMPNSSSQQQQYLYSAISSMANMITGRATILLAGKEKVIYISPPVVQIKSKDKSMFIKKRTIDITFTSRFGSMEVSISLTPAKK